MGKLLTILLQHNLFKGGPSCAVLRPLWMEELMHRSYNSVRLASLLIQRVPLKPFDHLSQDIELALAKDLAELYLTLASPPDRQLVACSPLLREFVVDLVSLFGPAVGMVELTTEIERVSLPSFQRRALVLAANELVMNALLHAFHGGRGGRLAVKLRRFTAQHACLTVSDNGIGYDGDPFAVKCGVAGSLAGLLASSLVYRRGNCGGTIAQIAFALDAQDRRQNAGRKKIVEPSLKRRHEIVAASIAGVRE
jgi:two-component sensor histidine kinase